MNRQIKYRGKASNMLYNGADILHHKGDWLYGDLIHQDGKCFIAPVDKRYPYGTSFLSFVVDADTVGQTTGFMDSDCMDVYDGDLIEYNNKIYVVKQDYGCSYIVSDSEIFEEYGNVNDYVLPLIHIFIQQTDWEDPIIDAIKIVGNRFDNPELLTDKTE